MSASPVILAFDTAAAHCAAALVRDGETLISRSRAMTKGQAEQLFPMLSDMLSVAGIGWTDIDAIGVGIGPGNFTGIRISVAAARGLALSLGVPAIGVSAFEALSFGVDDPVLCCVAAPRARFYLQVQNLPTAAAPCLTSLEAVMQNPAGLAWDVIGEAACAEPLSAALGRQALTPLFPQAEAIGHVAARRFPQATGGRPAPLYIRAADAAPMKDAPPVILDDA